MVQTSSGSQETLLEQDERYLWHSMKPYKNMITSATLIDLEEIQQPVPWH